MRTTSVIARIIGPVLLLRGLSILVDVEHFRRVLAGLDREVSTIAFSAFPIALLMACLALVVLHADVSSLAALIIRVMAWGGIVKASALILFPHVVVAKAAALGDAGFLTVVVGVCLAVGGYLTWFGYVSARAATPPS